MSRGRHDTITVVAQHDERFTADLVILAVGVRPDVQLAREAGLEIGPTGGIRVDDQMRTSDPHIFAVGDAVEVRNFVTGRPALIPLAGPANRQGRVAADVICGRDAHFRGSQGTAVVGVFDLTLAMTGETEKSLLRGRHRVREIVHPRDAPRLVLSRRGADFAEAAVFARLRPRARVRRPSAERASKSGST